MAITKESIEVKLKGLREQLQQLQANANAVSGAIQIAEQFLKEIDTPDPIEIGIDEVEFVSQ